MSNGLHNSKANKVRPWGIKPELLQQPIGRDAARVLCDFFKTGDIRDLQLAVELFASDGAMTWQDVLDALDKMPDNLERSIARAGKLLEASKLGQGHELTQALAQLFKYEVSPVFESPEVMQLEPIFDQAEEQLEQEERFDHKETIERLDWLREELIQGAGEQKYAASYFEIVDAVNDMLGKKAYNFIIMTNVCKGVAKTILEELSKIAKDQEQGDDQIARYINEQRNTLSGKGAAASRV